MLNGTLKIVPVSTTNLHSDSLSKLNAFEAEFCYAH